MLDRTANEVVTAPHLCEPFINGRNTGRLLHDLGTMLSLLNPKMLSLPILDFGAGSCWITEMVARMGHRVTAFDIHTDLQGCIDGRVEADTRIDRALISHATGDGHAMPFGDGEFGHTLCYDTLHHMHDYDKVFLEFARVLKPGGRAIFVEPGSKHSTSQGTIEFLKLKSHDPTWIERDVVLEEINQCATTAGFQELMITPAQHPNALMTFPMHAWSEYRNGNPELRSAVADRLASTNYEDRVIFYFDKL
jgi:SAM-dependent methyltransferase